METEGTLRGPRGPLKNLIIDGNYFQDLRNHCSAQTTFIIGIVLLLAPSGALVFIMVYYIQGSHSSKFFKFFRFESESESERTQHVL